MEDIATELGILTIIVADIKHQSAEKKECVHFL
jgi:hypothetical protein